MVDLSGQYRIFRFSGRAELSREPITTKTEGVHTVTSEVRACDQRSWVWDQDVIQVQEPEARTPIPQAGEGQRFSHPMEILMATFITPMKG
jgi:hypothetical protein